MKNPFDSPGKTVLAVSIATGTIAAGTVVYLFFTEIGSHLPGWLAGKLKDAGKELVSGFISDKTSIAKKTVSAVADHIVKS